jgi:hypothetical protein
MTANFPLISNGNLTRNSLLRRVAHVTSGGGGTGYEAGEPWLS